MFRSFFCIHYMIHFDTEKTPKNTTIFYCENCDFKCSKKGDWNRHIARPKHLQSQQMIQNDTTKEIGESLHSPDLIGDDVDPFFHSYE